MTDGTVVPFQRRPPKTPAKPGPSRARQLAAQQSSKGRNKYTSAQRRERERWLLQFGRPVPARITLALDIQGLEGPEVDVACGAAEPDVDLWECGELQPTAEQVRLLSALTGFPVAYFYEPIEPGPLVGTTWMCGPSGCESPEPSRVDERGVLHYGGEPARTPPDNHQARLF